MSYFFNCAWKSLNMALPWIGPYTFMISLSYFFRVVFNTVLFNTGLYLENLPVPLNIGLVAELKIWL